MVSGILYVHFHYIYFLGLDKISLRGGVDEKRERERGSKSHSA